MCSVPISPASNVLEHEPDRIGIFSKTFRAQSRLISVARIEGHEQIMNTIGMINGDKPRITF
jgi:hypothetical protein